MKNKPILTNEYFLEGSAIALPSFFVNHSAQYLMQKVVVSLHKNVNKSMFKENFGNIMPFNWKIGNGNITNIIKMILKKQ